MALPLLISFFSLAIILRILIQYYCTGDHGVRIARSDAPLIEKIPGALFILSFISSAILITLNHLGMFPIEHFFPPLADIGIGLLGFTGIATTVIAQMQIGRSWRIGVDQNEKTELIMNGLYSKSRNPIYFGILLYWLALSLCFSHPIMWVCAITCWSCIELIVRKVEEPYLRRTHGQAFDEYCRNSNRYLIL